MIKERSGFTLIELLVVMAVVLVIGTIVVGILFSSLRGSNKASSLDNVRRNGNYAIEQIGKMIKYAQSFDGVSADTNPASYKTSCFTQIPSSPTPSPAPVNYKYIKVTSFDGGQTIFSCINDTEIASLSAKTGISSKLVDTSTVRISSCSILCQQESIVSPPKITIGFKLTNVPPGGSSLSENQASVFFQTSITTRNY